jgi:prophage tail gpP-like protein
MPKYRGEEHRAEATDYPVPGRYYVIQKSDSAKGLSGISSKAYGDGKRWREIWTPNKKIARSDDPNRSFYSGDVIWIPGDYVEQKKVEPEVVETLTGADKNGIQIVVDGKNIPIISAQVFKSFDTATHGWVAVTPWKKELRPFGYQLAECYVGGKLKIMGRVFTNTPEFTPTGRVMRLEGWSHTADAVDSAIRPPYEQNKVTLRARAEALCKGVGVGVVWAAGEDKPFDRVTAQEGQSIVDHLGDLAQQRGIQLSSTNRGELLFHTAKDARNIGSFKEGYPPMLSGKCVFDGRKRFGSYVARGQSPGKTKAQATAVDPAVPGYRIMSFTADESAGSDMQKAANWQRSKALGESIAMEQPVNSWYNSDGELYEEGQLVTIISETLFVPEGYEYLISKVEYNLSENGADAVLSLVPPQVYTGEELPDPWYTKETA